MTLLLRAHALSNTRAHAPARRPPAIGLGVPLGPDASTNTTFAFAPITSGGQGRCPRRNLPVDHLMMEDFAFCHTAKDRIALQGDSRPDFALGPPTHVTHRTGGVRVTSGASGPVMRGFWREAVSRRERARYPKRSCGTPDMTTGGAPVVSRAAIRRSRSRSVCRRAFRSSWLHSFPWRVREHTARTWRVRVAARRVRACRSRAVGWPALDKKREAPRRRPDDAGPTRRKYTAETYGIGSPTAAGPPRDADGRAIRPRLYPWAARRPRLTVAIIAPTKCTARHRTTPTTYTDANTEPDRQRADPDARRRTTGKAGSKTTP